MKFLMFSIMSMLLSAQAHAFEYTCEAAVTIKEDGKVATTLPLKTRQPNEYSRTMVAERTNGVMLAIEFGGGYDYEATDMTDYLDKFEDTTLRVQSGTPLQRLPDGTLTVRRKMQIGKDGKTTELNYEMICRETAQN